MILLCLFIFCLACSGPVIASRSPECSQNAEYQSQSRSLSQAVAISRVSSSSSGSYSSSSSNAFGCNDYPCGRNATYERFPNPCPGTCSKPDGVPNCSRYRRRNSCECKPGYVISDDGRCILLRDCPDYLRCGGDRNATFKSCPNPCPRTCKYPGGTGPCSKLCLAEGCECKEGYYLNRYRKCVKLQDCPRAKYCTANENFVFCNVGCPNNFCPVNDNRATVACSPPFPCMSGCACKQNYLRLSREDDRCIPAYKCPPVRCTGKNEMWDGCPPPCFDVRCTDIGLPRECDQRFFSCRPQCVCKPGYCKNDSDICVPKPPKIRCGYNEMAVKCRTICPPQSCENSYTEYACAKPRCEPGCDCLPGHLRNASGICIPNEKCPPPPTIPICEQNEILSSCKIVCPPQTCASIFTLFNCIANIPCEWGCDCVSGYLRNSSGVCIPSKKCPTTPPPICGENEVPSDCKVICPPQTCDSIFGQFDCGANDVCEAGCDCIDGYLRNDKGVCILSEKCFLEPECNIPIECRPTCAKPNPPGCPYSPSETNQDGCNCQQGYILSEVGGQCIEIEKCPNNISCNGDPRATVKQCPQACPSTCDAPDNALFCKRRCDPVGCECKSGYILSDPGGKCILPDDCKRGNPCGPNGTYVPCKYNCLSSYCPRDDSRAVTVCDPPPVSACVSGCICKLNYRIKSVEDPRCIRSDECTPVVCTRRHERWNSCPIPCNSGYCNEVDNPPAPCNTLVLNCNPQCTCEDTFFRDPKTDLCVSSEECREINSNEQCSDEDED